MALIKCEECGKEISDKATTCPNCGSPTVSYLKETKDQEENISKQRVKAWQGLIIAVVSIGGLNALLKILPATKPFQINCIENCSPSYVKGVTKMDISIDPIVRVWISKDGTVSRAELERKSKSSKANEEAIKAAKEFIFNPIPRTASITIELGMLDAHPTHTPN